MPKTAQTEEFTPDVVMAMGEDWINAMLKATPPEEFLKLHKPDEILSYYQADEVLSHYNEEQIRAYLAKL